jgi:hypothetical protein
MKPNLEARLREVEAKLAARRQALPPPYRFTLNEAVAALQALDSGAASARCGNFTVSKNEVDGAIAVGP